MSLLSPMTLLAIMTVIIMCVIMGAASVSQLSEQAKAPITCKQIIDYNDKQDLLIRNGDYITERTVYKGYDTCSYKNGTEYSNVSLGYHTELEHGILWGGTR